MEASVAMTTTNSEREAKIIAEKLVKEKLAACVQIIPRISSVYFWDGKVHNDQEYLLLIKSRSDLMDDIRKFIEENHSYEVPEFLVLPVEGGLKSYLDWMKESTR